MVKVLCVAMIVGVLALACVKEDPAAVASEVAEEWAEESVENVVDTVVDVVLTVMSVPALVGNAAKDALRDLVVEQITDRLTWTTQQVNHTDGDLYQVVARASLTIGGDLPVIGTVKYDVALPFRVVVNVENRSVEAWSADLLGATVSSP